MKNSAQPFSGGGQVFGSLKAEKFVFKFFHLRRKNRQIRVSAAAFASDIVSFQVKWWSSRVPQKGELSLVPAIKRIPHFWRFPLPKDLDSKFVFQHFNLFVVLRGGRGGKGRSRRCRLLGYLPIPQEKNSFVNTFITLLFWGYRTLANFVARKELQQIACQIIGHVCGSLTAPYRDFP